MAASYNFNLIHLALQRRRIAEIPGLFAMQASFRSSRGRSGDTLVLHLALDGTMALERQEHQELVKKLAGKYYKTSGSSTSAMKSVAESLNHFLLESNQRGANRSIQSAGLFTQVVFRGDRLYLAQCGPTHTYLSKSTGISHYYISNMAWRGLGFTRVPEIRYHQDVVAPGDIILISPEPPLAWENDLLQQLRNLSKEEMIERLFTDAESDFEAGLIVVETGSGKLDIYDSEMIRGLGLSQSMEQRSEEVENEEGGISQESMSKVANEIDSIEEDRYFQGVLPLGGKTDDDSGFNQADISTQESLSSDVETETQQQVEESGTDLEVGVDVVAPTSGSEIEEEISSSNQIVEHIESDHNEQETIVKKAGKNTSRDEDATLSDLPGWTWILVIVVLLIGIIGLIFLIFQGFSSLSPDFTGLILPSETSTLTKSPTIIPPSPTQVLETNELILPTLTSTIPLQSATPTPTPKYGIGSTQVSLVDGMVKVYIPAGIFEMGAGEEDTAALRDERPKHSINLDAFWMDQVEVTNGQYALCVEEGECRIPYSLTSYTRNPYYGVPEFFDFPVIFISWQDAKDYCQWAGRRLPTEAEWEKAARGQEEILYPWGNEFNCELSNYSECLGDTAKANSYQEGASPYGVLNMAGNVWEWVADWYYFAYYDFSPFENPTGPSSGAYRVIRGGSWNDDPIYLRNSSRYWYYPENARFSVGFRCAISEYP